MELFSLSDLIIHSQSAGVGNLFGKLGVCKTPVLAVKIPPQFFRVLVLVVAGATSRNNRSHGDILRTLELVSRLYIIVGWGEKKGSVFYLKIESKFKNNITAGKGVNGLGVVRSKSDCKSRFRFCFNISGVELKFWYFLTIYFCTFSTLENKKFVILMNSFRF